MYGLILTVCIGCLIYSHWILPGMREKSISAFEAGNVSLARSNDGGYNMALNPLAVLNAPSIHLKLLVYDNASEDAINHGAGLVEGSGDIKNHKGHAILTAHNGDPTNDLFINVPSLKLGDHFYLTNSKGITDKYEIIQTQKVEPIGELQHLMKPTKGQFLVTLRTCVPIGINSHRFLATGLYKGHVKKIEKPRFTLSIVDYGLMGIGAVSGFLLVGSLYKERKSGKMKTDKEDAK